MEIVYYHIEVVGTPMFRYEYRPAVITVSKYHSVHKLFHIEESDERCSFLYY